MTFPTGFGSSLCFLLNIILTSNVALSFLCACTRIRAILEIFGFRLFLSFYHHQMLLLPHTNCEIFVFVIFNLNYHQKNLFLLPCNSFLISSARSALQTGSNSNKREIFFCNKSIKITLFVLFFVVSISSKKNF